MEKAKINSYPSEGEISGAESKKTLELSDLYRAQAKGSEVLKTYFFPYYSSNYIASCGTVKKAFLHTYTFIYDVVECTGGGLGFIIGKVAFVVSLPFTPLFHVFNKTVYQFNPVNGKRHLMLVPRTIEKWVGDHIFYPSATWGIKLKATLFHTDKTSDAAKRVAETFDLLKNNPENKKILNTDSSVQFNYRVETIPSSVMNAFAVPGGGMVVFTQIVKEIYGFINGGLFKKESKVTFADGSQVVVDLSGIDPQDVLAALLGHEMTHVASRHSMAKVSLEFLSTIFLKIGRFFAIHILQIKDQRYQELTHKKWPLNSNEQKELREKEKFYKILSDLFLIVENIVKKISSLVNSREKEYEADKTGVYLAKNAGFNPLGALALQEILSQNKGCCHKLFELLSTHPLGENRKRAIFAAIHELDRETLIDATRIAHFQDVSRRYDEKHLSPGMRYFKDNLLNELKVQEA